VVRRFDCASSSSNFDDTDLVCRRRFLACGEPVARTEFFAEARLLFAGIFPNDGPGFSIGGLELEAAAAGSTSD
jgi:hypothetical protein